MKRKVLTLEELGKHQLNFPETNGNSHDEKAGEKPATKTLIPEFEIPDLALPAVGMEIDFEAQAAKLKAGRTGMAAWVAKCLSELNKLAGLSEDARCLAASKISELTVALHGSLTHDFPPYRRAAWVALFQCEFGRDLSTREEVERLVVRLVSEGRLVPCIAETNHRLEIYGKTYAVSSDAMFEGAEIAETKKALAGLLARVYKKVGDARQIQARSLEGQATISLAQFLTGQPGRVYLNVPAVQENGFWRGGGSLLLASDGENASPIGVTGAIEGGISEAMRLKVFVKIYTLSWDLPPVVPGLDRERGQKLQLLWHLIARVINAEKKAAEIQANRQKLLGRANTLPCSWFLQEECGICAINLPIWEVKDAVGNVTAYIHDLTLVIERTKDGNISVLEMVARDPITDPLVSCMGEYEVTGEKYAGLPYPLRSILRAGYGQALRASQDAAKSAQI